MPTPKKKMLTAAQLEKMKVALIERRHEIQRLSLENLGDVEESIDEASGDSADRAAAALDRDILVDAAAREAKELHAIDEALAKIDAGTYGGCEECGNLIAMPRLQYIPNAKYCITCQERLEELGLLDDVRDEATPNE